MATTKKGARVNILNRLREMPSFHPVTTDLFSDWRLEAGDVITVTKKEGENPITGEPIEVSYGVPIFQMDLNWNGAPVVEVRSTGSKKRPDPAKLNRGGGYGGSRQKEETEINVSRYHTEIIKTDQQITSLAYETGLLPGVKEIFNRNKDYKIGDYVLYTPGDGTPTMTYRFIAPHTAGDAWDPSEVEVVHTQESRVTQSSDSIEQIVTAVGKDGEVTSASIVTAINNQTGQSVVRLHGDKIDLDGYVTTIALGAESSISAEVLLANDVLYAHSAELWVSGETYSPMICKNDLEEEKAVKDLSFTQNQQTGVCTLTWKDYDDTPHSETFSRAISNWTGSWNGNVLTVTASPQNQSTTETMGITISPTPSGGATSLTVDTFTAAHQAAINITASSITAAGGTYWKQFVIDASGVYTAGETAGGTAAGVTKGTWANGVLQVTRATSSSTKSTTITLSGGTPTWNGTTVSIPVNDGQGPTHCSVTASAASKLYALPTVTPTSSQQTFTAGSGDYANYIGFSSVTVGPSSGSIIYPFSLNLSPGDEGIVRASTYGWDGFSEIEYYVSGGGGGGHNITYTEHNFDTFTEVISHCGGNQINITLPSVGKYKTLDVSCGGVTKYFYMTR